MSKPAKPAASQTTDMPPPKKSKKKLIVVIVVMALLIGGGAAAFLLLKPAHAPDANAVKEETRPEAPPKFVVLGTFTANLMQEEGDRYLQVAISLKLTNSELEEKIKVNNPEILHRVNMLLQSKYPSDLATFDGKQKLADQIKGQVEYVLGLRKTAPAITESEAPSVEGIHAAQAAPTEVHTSQSGIADVLFTSFLIQ